MKTLFLVVPVNLIYSTVTFGYILTDLKFQVELYDLRRLNTGGSTVVVIGVYLASLVFISTIKNN